MIEFSPANKRARVGLGRQLAATRRFDEAATILEEGLTLDPENPELQLELAQSRELAGDHEQAASFIAPLPTAPPICAPARWPCSAPASASTNDRRPR